MARFITYSRTHPVTGRQTGYDETKTDADDYGEKARTTPVPPDLGTDPETGEPIPYDPAKDPTNDEDDGDNGGVICELWEKEPPTTEIEKRDGILNGTIRNNLVSVETHRTAPNDWIFHIVFNYGEKLIETTKTLPTEAELQAKLDTELGR